MAEVEQWLEDAELGQYVANFANVTPQEFITITIQDYSEYGINSLEDKQKLFRLITQLKNEPEQAEEAENTAAPAEHVYEREPPESENAFAHESAPQFQNPPPEHLSENLSRLNPNIHPKAPSRPDARGLPTTIRTVVPPDDVFLNLLNEKIRVVVRKRPVNENEMNLGQRDICSVDGWNQISVHEPKVKVDLTKYIEIGTFRFDQVFGETSDNYEVYFYTAKPLIEATFEGRNTTCFAYGETGSGKTWTMMQRETGVYVLAAHDIFNMMECDPTYSRLGLTATVSFFEIYGGKLFDLLNNRARLEALEDGKGNVHVQGLEQKQIGSVPEMLAYIDQGLEARSVGATGANADSSRSHAIMQIRLIQPNQSQHSMISFIDLAGAERASDVENTDRETRMEGAEINKSLLALKECIRAMDRGAHHLPFRGSKLTMVLRDSFIGEAETVMIACISPSDRSSENTNNTLRYADRVKDANEWTRVKQAVIKPSENAADIVIGSNVSDTENAQAEYNKRITEIKGENIAMAYQQEAPQEQYEVNIPVVSIEAQEVPRASSRPNELEMTHENVVDSIYDLEDQITKAHRREVDQMMVNVKEEVTLLHAIENDQISIDDWVIRLEAILAEKEGAIRELKEQLAVFKDKLNEEQELSQSVGKK